MSLFHANETVGQVIRRHPEAARVFERAGIDYCCGGGVTLEDASRDKGLTPEALLSALEDVVAGRPEEPENLSNMTLGALIDHIERTHHEYLRAEFPRLNALTEKVARVHGDRNPRLLKIRDVWARLFRELSDHMLKEEQILFPMVRQLERDGVLPATHCGPLSNPVGQMEREHVEAEEALALLRELTDGHIPPPWACGTYRAMLEALSRLEGDLLVHMHKEDAILFPRALEAARRGIAAAAVT